MTAQTDRPTGTDDADVMKHFLNLTDFMRFLTRYFKHISIYKRLLEFYLLLMLALTLFPLYCTASAPVPFSANFQSHSFLIASDHDNGTITMTQCFKLISTSPQRVVCSHQCDTFWQNDKNIQLFSL